MGARAVNENPYGPRLPRRNGGPREQAPTGPTGPETLALDKTAGGHRAGHRAFEARTPHGSRPAGPYFVLWNPEELKMTNHTQSIRIQSFRSIRMQTMSICFKIIDTLSDFAGGVSALIMIFVAGAVVFEVISRFLFNMPTNWSVEFSIYGVVAVTFLGASYVEKKALHIRVDFIVDRLPAWSKNALELITYLWSVVFMLFFLNSAATLIQGAWSQHRVSMTVLRTPMWIPYSIMLFGMLLLLLQFIKQLFIRIINLIELKNKTQPKGTILKSAYFVLPIFILLMITGYFVFSLGGNSRIIGFGIILFTLLLTGTPVFLSLALVGGIGFFILGGHTTAMLMQLPVTAYTGVESFVLAALPLFIFAGGLFAQSGLTGKLFDFCNVWLSRVPGNLAMATIISCAIFSALSGSSVAVAATVGMIAIPAMIERGYDKRIACGSVVAAGTLGSMIPPSNQFIIYGAITDTSVGQLFMAGVLPGIFITIIFLSYLYIRCRKDPRYKAQEGMTWRKRFEVTKSSLPVLIAPLIILGGIYGGIFTPTEAAAVAVLYGFLLCLYTRTIKLKNAYKIFSDAASKSSMILMAIMGAMILGVLVTILQIAPKFTQFVLNSNLPPWGVIVMIMILTLMLGCLMDGIALTLIVVPVTFSAITAMGFDPIWFGVLFCLNMEMGLVTPPVGMTLYTVQGVTGENMEDVFKGAIPFLLLMLGCLTIVGLFESMSTWLPSLMIK